jgi:signal peptidase I
MKRPKSLSLIIYALLVAAIVGLAVAVHVTGISAYVITGASMTGDIPKGSLAIDRNVPVSSLQVGDVITFQPPLTSGNVTHRIIAIDKDADGNRVFKTKGDFNESADPWQFTLDRPVQAKYVFHVPWIGYVLAAFTLRLVRTAVLGVVGLLILFMTIAWLRKPLREDEDEDQDEAAPRTVSPYQPGGWAR